MTQAKAKRKRRTRTQHEGVNLLQVQHRSGEESWVVRWRDPDSKKLVQRSCEKLGLTNAEARRGWAIEKAKDLQARRRELERGAVRHTGTALREAWERYLEDPDGGGDLKPQTRSNYTAGVEELLGWLEAERQVTSLDQLRFEVLDGYRETRLGARPTGRERSRSTVNSRMVAAKVFLRWACTKRLLPHLRPDEVSAALRSFKTKGGRPRPAYLKPPALKKLLSAVAKHDAAAFGYGKAAQRVGPHVLARTARQLASYLAVTESRVSQLRKEPWFPARNEGGWEVGEVFDALDRYAPRRHVEAAPFVLTGLLLGARREELERLRWDRLDLEAGVIEIDPDAEGKTGQGRDVWLEHTPELRRLLIALKLRASSDLVFPGWSKTVAQRVRKRLVEDYGAPEFMWSQQRSRTPSLRSTCATYCYNAPFWGQASHWAASQRLGHDPKMGRQHYARRYPVKRDAQDLEQAMEVSAEISALVDQVTGRRARETA